MPPAKSIVIKNPLILSVLVFIPFNARLKIELEKIDIKIPQEIKKIENIGTL